MGSLVRREGGGIHNGSGGSSSGGGGDGRGERDAPSPRDRLLRARLGLGVALTPVLMMFLTFSVTFVVLRFAWADSGSAGHSWTHVPLPVPLLLVNSLVLVLSGATMELSRRAIARQVALAPVLEIPGVSLGKDRRIPWLLLTVALGFAFLAGQAMAWRELSRGSYMLQSNRASSFFYLLTMLHAIHLGGGLLALLYASVMPILHKALDSRRLVVDVTAWYWHFMTALWLVILPLLIAVS